MNDDQVKLRKDQPVPYEHFFSFTANCVTRVVRKAAEQAATEYRGKGILPQTPQQVMQRVGLAAFYLGTPLKEVFRWLAGSVETDNFTYRLTPTSRKHLMSFLAMATGESVERIDGYLTEVETDDDLKQHCVAVAAQRRGPEDTLFEPGRRIGWYALTRILKPKLVIETGVHLGYGAVTLASALLRNQAEGHPGRYLGTEINPKAGRLLQGKYAEMGEIRYGDSATTLQNLDQQVDLFINDSDHSAEYELKEYHIILDKLAPGGMILSDNAHATDSLWDFAREKNLHYLFFREQPEHHWYPGAGIGLAWRR